MATAALGMDIMSADLPETEELRVLSFIARASCLLKTDAPGQALEKGV